MTKVNFKAILMLIISTIIGVFVLGAMVHNTSLDKSQCLISQGDVCITTGFLIVMGIFMVINVFLLYKIHPALFWIWLILQALGIFGFLDNLGSSLRGIIS